MTDFLFFCPARSATELDKFSFHIHTLRPPSSSEETPAYVVQIWSAPWTSLTVTDGHENVVVGPRVCEITGCIVDIYKEKI